MNAPPDRVEFRQATPEQIARAAEVCYRIYRETPIGHAFSSPETVLRRWRWIMDGNPVRSPFGIPAWVAARGAEVVGHFGLIPAHGVLDGQVVPVAWGRDFFVDPAFQGRGVGPSLVSAAVRAAGTVLVAGLNPAARRAYARVGFTDRGQIPFYVKVLRPTELSSAIVPGGGLPGWAIGLAVEGAAAWARRRGDPCRNVRTTESFDEGRVQCLV